MENRQVTKMERTMLSERQPDEWASEVTSMISDLWLATRHTKDQENEKQKIFELWMSHILQKPGTLKASIKKSMRIILETEEWWPSIATFEKLLRRDSSAGKVQK